MIEPTTLIIIEPTHEKDKDLIMSIEVISYVVMKSLVQGTRYFRSNKCRLQLERMKLVKL